MSSMSKMELYWYDSESNEYKQLNSNDNEGKRSTKLFVPKVELYWYDSKSNEYKPLVTDGKMPVEGSSGSGVLSFDTVSDLMNTYPDGIDKPVWVVEDKAWYYWDADRTPPNDVSNLKAIMFDTSVTLNWVESSSDDVRDYIIFNGEELVDYSIKNSFKIYGLNPSTEYKFTVKSRDLSGNISNGVIVVGTTLNEPDITPPNEVTNVDYISSENSIKLSWTSSDSSDIAGYQILQGSTVLDITSNNEFVINNLLHSTEYRFTIKSFDLSNNYSEGVMITASTTIKDVTPPLDVTNLTGVETYNSISLTWERSISEDVREYEIYADGGFIGTTNNNTYTVNNLSESTIYEITVKAKDDSGNLSNGVKVVISTSSIVAGTVILHDDFNTNDGIAETGQTWNVQTNSSTITIDRKSFELETKISNLKNGMQTYLCYITGSTNLAINIHSSLGIYYLTKRLDGKVTNITNYGVNANVGDVIRVIHQENGAVDFYLNGGKVGGTHIVEDFLGETYNVGLSNYSDIPYNELIEYFTIKTI
jgi:chitodextrinase